MNLDPIFLSVTLKEMDRHTQADTHSAQWWEEKVELFQEWDNRSPGIVAINEWIDGWMDEGGDGRNEWSPGQNGDSLTVSQTKSFPKQGRQHQAVTHEEINIAK